MTNTVKEATLNKLNDLYEIDGMENITVSEPTPTSHQYPFLLAMTIAFGIAVVVSIFHFHH